MKYFERYGFNSHLCFGPLCIDSGNQRHFHVKSTIRKQFRSKCKLTFCAKRDYIYFYINWFMWNVAVHVVYRFNKSINEWLTFLGGLIINYGCFYFWYSLIALSIVEQLFLNFNECKSIKFVFFKKTVFQVTCLVDRTYTGFINNFSLLFY